MLRILKLILILNEQDYMNNFRFIFSEKYDADFFDCENGGFIFVYLKAEKIKFPDLAQELKSKYESKLGRIICISGALKTKNKSEPLEPVWFDSVAELICKEQGVKVLLEAQDVLNPGLFLDQNANRKIMLEIIQRLQKKKEDLKLLNLFSYTGVFSVVARSQNVETASVDVSSRYLKWEEKSHTLNIHDGKSKTIKADARNFLNQAIKRGEKYNLIIIDPPSFSRSDGKIFKVEKELPLMVPLALNCLATHGVCLVSSNLSTWSLKDFNEEMKMIAQKHGCEIQSGALPDEFKNQKYPLKSLWFHKNT